MSEQGSGTASTAEKPKQPAQPRDYVVLGKVGDGTWKELRTVKATTDKKAIEPFARKQLALDNQAAKLVEAVEQPGKNESYEAFVAIPSRSWNVRKPKVKTVDPQLSW